VSRRPIHPWCVTAPWYRWPAAGVPVQRPGRCTGPTLQKYATAGFATEFLAQPQHSLKFVDEDHWQYLGTLPALAPYKGRKRRFSDEKLVTTQTRKLFLPNHSRFYLVSASLHCDVPGLPEVPRTQVRRVGFVVRRRTLTPPPGAVKPPLPQEILQQLAQARVALGDIPIRDLDADVSSHAQKALSGPVWSSHYAERTAAVANLVSAQQKLASWARTAGLTPTVQGWIPDPDKPEHGAWVDLDSETPDSVTEEVHPMYPVVAPTGDQEHDAAGAGLWFGAVPTGSRQVAADGAPRFDDESLYEIRCFAQREDDCHPEPVWSLPTDRYVLAAAMDLVGTSHRPTTIKLPDIPRLRAQMAAMKPGEGAGVRLESPPGSLTFTADKVDATDTGPSEDTEICSFALPLIMIVAMFVFKLFLGIVMLVFQLWWMLALKFCIPPSLEIGGGLDAELSALPPNIDLDASIDVTVNLGTLAQIDALLHQDFEKAFGKEAADNLLAQYSPGALLELHTRLRANMTDAPSPAIDGALEYEPHVSRDDVVVV
jgi:hypothetical protein